MAQYLEYGMDDRCAIVTGAGAALSIIVIFCAIIFITRFNYVRAQHPVLIAACDALFSIGVVYIIWGSSFTQCAKESWTGFSTCQGTSPIYTKRTVKLSSPAIKTM